MFFNSVKLLISLAIILSPKVHANDFFLEPLSDREYKLITPASVGYNVVVDMQGAKELFYYTEYKLKCAGGRYIVPVIQGYIENSESSSEHLEYFVFDITDGNYEAIKSISSLYVVERDSGEVIQSHILTSNLSDKSIKLCPYITVSNDIDYPIQKIPKVK